MSSRKRPLLFWNPEFKFLPSTQLVADGLKIITNLNRARRGESGTWLRHNQQNQPCIQSISAYFRACPNSACADCSLRLRNEKLTNYLTFNLCCPATRSLGTESSKAPISHAVKPNQLSPYCGEIRRTAIIAESS